MIIGDVSGRWRREDTKLAKLGNNKLLPNLVCALIAILGFHCISANSPAQARRAKSVRYGTEL
jgi:uncharacterized protein (DUF2062 family)